jgi:hypothetical protein
MNLVETLKDQNRYESAMGAEAIGYLAALMKVPPSQYNSLSEIKKSLD